jgi:hypothetical protein
VSVEDGQLHLTRPSARTAPGADTGDERQPYGIPVFFSYPTPCNAAQEQFVKDICAYLKGRGISARTLGVTDYDLQAPLRGVRRIMLESNGVITIAFRRTLIERGRVMGRARTGEPDRPVEQVWSTSPWAQIEPAMAYQLGLPILLMRESGVIADGLLQGGIVGIYTPEFSLDGSDRYLASAEWSSLVGAWEGQVRTVVERKARPPVLY